ncbi:unnamed protein product [Colias eurytheme]|nr:unnamed protein product [Colias eurytheme]
MYHSPPHANKTLSAPQLNLNSEEGAFDSNITLRCEKRRRLSGDEKNEFAIFKSEMHDMLLEMFNKLSNNQNCRLDKLEKTISELDKNIISVKNTNKDIEVSINFLSDKIEDLHDQIKVIKNESKNIDIRLNTIEDRMNNLERGNRKTSIEIRKLPKKVNERKNDLFVNAEHLLNSLSLQSLYSNIRDVFRLPSRKEAHDSPVIVEFTDTQSKDKVLDAIKKFNKKTGSPKINTNHFGFEGQPSPAFVSDYLTPVDRRMFYCAREFAKSESYAFCWMSNGRIYLRQKEGSPHILIKNEDQLRQIKRDI